MIRRGSPKLNDGIGYDEWRACHSSTCGAKFRPAVGLSGESTEYHRVRGGVSRAPSCQPCATGRGARRGGLDMATQRTLRHVLAEVTRAERAAKRAAEKRVAAREAAVRAAAKSEAAEKEWTEAVWQEWEKRRQCLSRRLANPEPLIAARAEE